MKPNSGTSTTRSSDVQASVPTPTKPRRLTYPSGLVCSRHTYENKTGSLRIHVERVISHGRNNSVVGMPVGSWEVEGTIILSGDALHNSLPCRSFRTRGAADAFARGMFRKFSDQAETNG